MQISRQTTFSNSEGEQPTPACFLLPLLLFLSPHCLAQPREFVLMEMPPYLDAPTNQQIGVGNAQINFPEEYPGPVHPDVQYLNSSYKLLSQAGYTTPVIRPWIHFTSSGAIRYAVFRYDFDQEPLPDEYDGSELGVYIVQSACGTAPGLGKNNWIAINTNVSSKAAFERKHTFSHELFHAFQEAYPLFESPCGAGANQPAGWIMEGMADAAANILTEHSFTKDWMTQTQPGHLSLRSYRIAFQDRNDWLGHDPYFKSDVAPRWSGNYGKKAGGAVSSDQQSKAADMMEYNTSGFWQFLARRSTGIRSRSAPGPELSRLLATWIPLLQKPSPGRPGTSVVWLGMVNEYIDEHLPLKNTPTEMRLEGNALYGWFPEFLTEYATWWEQRHSQLGPENEKLWLDVAFGGCESVTLKPGKAGSVSTQKLTLKNFRKNSGRCIDVKLSGFSGPINLDVQAFVDNPLRADQLHLGLARSEAPLKDGKKVKSCWDSWDSDRLECVQMGKVNEDPPSKAWKTEQFTAQGLKLPGSDVSARLTYVVSNVALEMDETKTIKELELVFSATYADGKGKKFAPPNSIRPADPQKLTQAMKSNPQEVFYRLYTSAAVSPSNMFDIELNQLDDGEQPRCSRDGGDPGACAYDTGGDYFIRPVREITFGQTGPIAAAVHKVAGEQPFLVSSTCSADADMKAVEILESSDNGVVIRVDTDLCEIPTQENNYCNRQQTCPARDRLSVRFTLGLGREHFAETAPIHRLTPGTRFDMELYFRDGMPTGAGSGSGSKSSGSGGADGSAGSDAAGTPQPDGSVVTSTSKRAAIETCACTCEEQAETARRGRAIKAESEAGGNVEMGSIMELTRCNSICQREYMACTLDQSARERAREEERRRAAADRISEECDCSCAGLTRSDAQVAAMQDEMRMGKSPSVESLRVLTQCQSTCQAEYARCRVSGQR